MRIIKFIHKKKTPSQTTHFNFTAFHKQKNTFPIVIISLNFVQNSKEFDSFYALNAKSYQMNVGYTHH